MLSNLGGWHLLIILAIVILIFGATKLPALAKSVGQSVNIFKGEMKAASSDDATTNITASDTTVAPVAPSVAPTVAPTSVTTKP